MVARLATLMMPLVILAAAGPVPAQTPPDEPVRVEVGTLACTVEPGSGDGDVARNIACSFMPKEARPPESYDGQIRTVLRPGAAADKTVMTWQVLAPVPEVDVGALAGDYEGAATPADGGRQGDNPAFQLTGGVHGAIALRPLSVAAGEVLAVAGIFIRLELRSVKA